jgi:hypothetical protein
MEGAARSPDLDARGSGLLAFKLVGAEASGGCPTQGASLSIGKAIDVEMNL